MSGAEDATDSTDNGEDEGTIGPKPGRFGTFGGVFTPSILTILGVVMYMRMGWVTGHAGLGVASRDRRGRAPDLARHGPERLQRSRPTGTVGAGGAYFMISRSLGGPAGAAIGIPLFFAQALSVTFYIVGFAESVLLLFPEAYRVVRARVARSGPRSTS